MQIATSTSSNEGSVAAAGVRWAACGHAGRGATGRAVQPADVEGAPNSLAYSGRGVGWSMAVDGNRVFDQPPRILPPAW